MADEAARIGPVAIERMTTASAIERIAASLDGRAPSMMVAFCNAHTAKLAFDDPDFARQLGTMLVLNDGIGIELAARMLTGHGFPDNLNGTDFVPAMLARIGRPLRLYLLGGRPDVVARAATVIGERFPQHVVAGARDGYFEEGAFGAVAAEISAARPDLVLCAMGNPLQERIVARLFAQRCCPVLIGVGALFDFLADAVPRAPQWVRRMRLEFLYRLWQEPRRLGRRYTVEAAAFMFAILRLRLARQTPHYTRAR
jgi:beta-1,4-glucosyltransferase